MSKRKKNLQSLTTSDIAKICGVSTRTVSKWFEDDLLDGYLLPGSTHRRFTYEAVQKFLEENNMPLDKLEELKEEIPS